MENLTATAHDALYSTALAIKEKYPNTFGLFGEKLFPCKESPRLWDTGSYRIYLSNGTVLHQDIIFDNCIHECEYYIIKLDNYEYVLESQYTFQHTLETRKCSIKTLKEKSILIKPTKTNLLHELDPDIKIEDSKEWETSSIKDILSLLNIPSSRVRGSIKGVAYLKLKNDIIMFKKYPSFNEVTGYATIYVGQKYDVQTSLIIFYDEEDKLYFYKIPDRYIGKFSFAVQKADVDSTNGEIGPLIDIIEQSEDTVDYVEEPQYEEQEEEFEPLPSETETEETETETEETEESEYPTIRISLRGVVGFLQNGEYSLELPNVGKLAFSNKKEVEAVKYILNRLLP